VKKSGFFIVFIAMMMTGTLTGQSDDLPIYKNRSLPVEARVDDLIARMTLEEKIGQMLDHAPAIPRLDIPEYNWWSESLHGVARAGIATVFPQAIGLAATFDTDLMFRVADVISTEARAKYHEFVRNGDTGRFRGLTMWSPNVNIFRDPRWGRGQETYGEDPFLTSRMGVAFVKGLQGNDPRYFKVISTPKHYAVHSGPEFLRHEFNAIITGRALYDTYLPAFEACVREGGAYSVMCAYNRVLGKACCGSSPLLQKILRDSWNFKGYVVSDCGAISDIHVNHHLSETSAEASALAVKSGTDLNCGNTYLSLEEAVGLDLLSEQEIDKAVKRLFMARFKLGMFDGPEDPYAQIPIEKNNCAEHSVLARQAAQASIVLLKNENHFLPLKFPLDTIAVIGPNADRLSVLLGNYNGTPSDPVTLLQGIREKAGSRAVVLYEPGCYLADQYELMQPIPESAFQLNGMPGLLAEYFENPDLAGPPAAIRQENEIDYNWWTVDAFPVLEGETFSIRWSGVIVPEVSGDYRFSVFGNRSIRVFIQGKKKIEFFSDRFPQRKQADLKLRAGEAYPIVVEYANGRQFPYINLSWAHTDDYAGEKALALAKKADIVIFAGGISPDLEGEEMDVPYPGFEGGDRTEIDLPAIQTELLKALYKTGTPVVLVLNSGSALAVQWAHEHLPAIIQGWYPGQSGGIAIADVLFGDVNPGGRLPVTFYQSVKQLPPFEDYSMTGHTYRYFKGEPLYAFGYGLSYSKFEYEHLNVPDTIRVGDHLPVSVQVRNTGQYAGDEVVQIYVKDNEASFPVPGWALQGFQRVHLYPGEIKTVAFTLEPRQLALITDDLKRLIEPGVFTIAAGGGLPGRCGETTAVITERVVLEGDPLILEKLSGVAPE
jgi:beta-glucosidase